MGYSNIDFNKVGVT